MSPRPYRMARRAESAEQTRRRIVQATAELHDEKGIGGTTLRDIAVRADVALGTVYHHFPSYDDVITACGALTMELTRPPTPAIFDGITDAAARIRTLVREVFEFYARAPFIGRVRGERHAFAPIDASFREEEEMRRALISAAFRGRRPRRGLRALAFALLDFTTWENLIASGLTQRAAIEEITTVLMQRSSE